MRRKPNMILESLPLKFQQQALDQGAKPSDRTVVGKLVEIASRKPRKRREIPVANETALVKSALTMLLYDRITCWRNNTGGAEYENKDKSKRFVRYGIPGASDILGVLPGGRFLAAEAKVGRNKPTDEQWAFLNQVNAAGGLGIWFRSLKELDAKVKAGVGDTNCKEPKT
jgi:hypothetical protein